MNFADIQQAWASAHNRPSAAAIEAHKATLHALLARRRRGFVALVTAPVVVLGMVTGMVAWRMAADDLFDLERQWASLLLLALPWLTLVWFLRRQSGHLRRHPDYRHSFAAGLRALLDENRQARMRARTLIALHLACLPVLALAARQLAAAGKARPHEMQSMLLFFGTVIALAAGAQLLWLVRKLRPEQARLEQLLRSCEG